MNVRLSALLALCACALASCVAFPTTHASTPPPRYAPVTVTRTIVAPAPGPTGYDAALARRLGGDSRGMRPFVLVILRTGPTRVAEGPRRDAMFAGHFANMDRLAKAGKLVLAGPFTADPDNWRGMYVFATDDVEEARRLTSTDPVIVNGEMVPEFHRWYGSAATMMLPEIHDRLTPAATP